MNVTWVDTFELGVPEIDGDHRTIIHLMNLVEDALTGGRKREEMVALIDRLFAFTSDHFRREEMLLEGWGFGEVEHHALYHSTLLDSAENIKAVCLEREHGPHFRSCCDELLKFLIDDVVKGDLRLKSFLQYQGIAAD